MEKFYDTVIIGGGPAGMACAVTLKRQKLQPCVIDKAVFPRHKTCAGLVTDKTYSLIKKLFNGDVSNELFSAETSEIKLFKRSDLLSNAELDNCVRLVSRKHFDNELVRLYKSLGGTMLEGEKNLKIDYDKKRVTLSDKSEITYRHLVFADGALSMSRKLTGIKNTDLAFGIEAYIPYEMLPIDSVNLYFDYLKSGYIWAFPHGDTVCVGAADRYRKNEQYKDIFVEFLNDMKIDPEGLNYIGAFLPYGKTADQRSLPEGVMLIGDAAGFTDPISGEGLYMALESGISAAESIVKPKGKSVYLKRVEPLNRIVKGGRKVQGIFYSPMFKRVFMRRVKGNGRVVKFYFENMVENYRYSYYGLRRLYGDYKKLKKNKAKK